MMATPPSEDNKHFVDQHKEELIRYIDNVEAILSELLEDRLLISEECEAVRTRRTNPERMSKLFSFIQAWSRCQKDKFYQALKNQHPAAVCHMERALEQATVTNEEREQYIERHKENMKSRFELMKDRNYCMGESVSLRRRYIKLVLLRKFRGEEEKKRELSSSGEEHVQLLIDRSSEEYFPTSMEELFVPDDNGVVPKNVVLHGPTGIGKSMTAHKISLDWATLNLYADKFDFLFYVSYKDLEQISSNISLAGLISNICRMKYPPEIMRDILAKGEKLGFIINGFDEVKWALKAQSHICKDPFKEVPKDVLLRSLLKGQLVRGASLIITTRPFALEKLQALLADPPRLVEIVGYTGEARESYIRVYFGMRDKEKAVDITRRNQVLFTLCTVPFMCWVVSTVTKQMLNKYPSNFTTDTSMFLYYLKGLIKYHSRNTAVVSSLRKVCALANEGVLNQKVLFEEEDLRRHKLSISSVESVFLNTNVLHGDIGKRTCYSFIHHSFQEFLAVVYYALPRKGESGRKVTSGVKPVREGTYLPEICKGRSLVDLLEKHPHLALPVRFLFGLLNQDQNKDFTKTSGCSLYFQGTSAMIDWLFGGEISEFDTERMRFLYETRDDETMQYVVSRAVDLTFSQCQKPDNWVHQLAFCLKACAGRKVTLFGYVLDGKDLTVVIPLLKKCPQVCFRSCRFADDVNSSAGWKKSLFTSLITQDSKIEELCLVGCILPSSTCEVLVNAGRHSLSLSSLCVTFKAEKKEEREEMRRYMEAFKAPECTMSTRKMMGKTWFLLRCKLQKVPVCDVRHGMRWDRFDPEEFPFDYHSQILFSRRHL